MVFDHTPLTPPPIPEAHLWSPYCNFVLKKSVRNGTYNIKMEFY